MYRGVYQRGMLTIFFSCGSKPLNQWETRTKDGYISRFLDPDIKSMVLEIGGTNVSTTYMICPKGKQVLGITMPFLVMIVKNLKKYFSFEVTVLDDTGTRRRFRVANFQSTTQILPLCTVMPIGLSDGWNQIQFNLAEFTRRAYQKQFVEVQKLKINANIRLRRIYFAERLIPEDQLPPEYKLYFPLSSKEKGKKALKPAAEKEFTKPSTSLHEVKTEEERRSSVLAAEIPTQPVEALPIKEAVEEVAQPEGAAETVAEKARQGLAEDQAIPKEGEETATETAVSEGAQEGEPVEEPTEELTEATEGEPTEEPTEGPAEEPATKTASEPAGEVTGETSEEPPAEPEAEPTEETPAESAVEPPGEPAEPVEEPVPEQLIEEPQGELAAETEAPPPE